MSHKGYLDYLELFKYFGVKEGPRLSAEDYEIADSQYRDLAARFVKLDHQERLRLAELKALLMRDRP